ncbi:MAG: hypothetical protein M1825_000047, partial [Sarcosagium campestre]
FELYRLEQRYTRQRRRRSTFVSGARYVDGEYISSSNSSPRLEDMQWDRFARGRGDAGQR